MTDYLSFSANLLNIYKPLLHIFKKGLEKSRGNTIVDLCSGGGGGILKIYEELKAEGLNVKIILTDLYPNINAFKHTKQVSRGNIDYSGKPVDAANVPAELKGFRTQLISFHHFKPEQAKQILKNAADSGVPIGIFEATERKIPNLIAMLFSPLLVLLFTPFIRPFKLSRLLFTYIIPAIPLFTLWDGLVSVLRSYTPEEMKEMAESVTPSGSAYKWESGREGKQAKVVYLLGYPEALKKIHS
jgi:hypothetical protein